MIRCRALFFYVVTAVGLNSQLFAQATKELVPSQPIRLAMARLESPDQSDWQKSKTELLGLKKGDNKEQAISGLALFHVRQSNQTAIENFLRRVPSLFPNPSNEQKSLLLRIKLWHAITSENPSEATQHFSELAKITLTEKLSMETTAANAAILGNVIGLLEPDEAHSPIAKSVLASVKSNLETHPGDASHEFKDKNERGRQYSSKLAEWLRRNAELNEDERANLATNERRKVEAEIEKQQQLVFDHGHSVTLLDKQLKGHSKSKKAIQQELKMVMGQLANPRVLFPVMPNRNAIQVPTEERIADGKERVEKTRKVTQRDGTKKEETYYEEKTKNKTVNRSRADIDRDIDAIYLRLVLQYENLVAMRDAIIQQRVECERKAKETNDEIARLENSMSEAKTVQLHQRNVVRELQDQHRVLTTLCNAIQAGDATKVFRPSSFEIFDFAAEKRALLQ